VLCRHPYLPTLEKTKRLHAQTAILENGLVYIPDSAPGSPT